MTDSAIKLVFVTLEFSAATFSGNGIYAIAQVRALQAAGLQVKVLMGCPSDSASVNQTSNNHIQVVVPSEKWGRLDESSPWSDFVAGAQAPAVLEALDNFRPDAVVCVDWHGCAAWQGICSVHPRFSPVPHLYLSYRVFSRNELHSYVVQDEERRAVMLSRATVVLSRADQEFVRRSGWLAPQQECKFLPPALRQDVAQLPPPLDASSIATFRAKRKFITCCVRLSPEKEPLRFVELVRSLGRDGVLQKHGLTPLLCASTDSDYAREVKRAFREAAPDGVLEERFLGPRELSEIYAQTRLNVHPCLYDAFGMTIVEAASQGAPSVVHNGGTVGATDVLKADLSQLISVDMDRPADELAQDVAAVLADTERLLAVSRSACSASRAYDEASNAQQLLDVLIPHIQCLDPHEG